MDFCKDLIEIGESAKASSRVLMRASTGIKNKALLMIADALKANEKEILEANAKDMKNAEEKGIRRTLLNRLALTSKDLDKICDAVRNVASLPDPVGNGEIWTRPNGLEIHKVSVPMGVIAIIYEARPNVTVDAAALCLKSGNACILRGGSEAFESNMVLVKTIVQAIKEAGLPEGSVQMLRSSDRELVNQLMKMTDYVDLIIPRGGAELIKNVVSNSQVPFIETGTGICHAFVHKDADIKKAVQVVANSKADKPEACNALETLIVDEAIAQAFLPQMAEALKERGVTILGCEKTVKYIKADLADEEDWSVEHLDLIINIKIVDGLDEALNHIYKYSTKHSEVIITENYSAAQRFLKEVDAAAVYVNASTRFTDGGRFGFGAEIGISTQKMHARGPMGLPELTTIKYTIYGDGQIVTK